MKKRSVSLFAALATATALAAPPALADLVVPNLSYRTGPYAANGAPYADGFNDYFTMLNERDGGVGGQKILTPECETSYNTEKGVECYESFKGQNPVVIAPVSTGIAYQLIPKVTADKIPMYTPGLGRTSSQDGRVFEWVFNAPTNYWDGASIAVKYLLDEHGGDLSDKTIALLYHDSAFGKEPIRTLEELSKKHGFKLTLIAVDPGSSQEQKSQWLQIRREKPDNIIMYGWGVMNPAAIQEAANVRYPLDQMIGIWWSGTEVDVLAAGAGANGYKALAFHGSGQDYPIYDDLRTYVFDKGLASAGGSHIGTVLYSRGLHWGMVTAEAIRKAQELHGTDAVTAEQVRDGFEALDISEERLAELGLSGFSPAIKTSCEDHGGSGMAFVQQWDASAKTWNRITDFYEPDNEVVDALIRADSEAFAKENNITLRCN